MLLGVLLLQLLLLKGGLGEVLLLLHARHGHVRQAVLHGGHLAPVLARLAAALDAAQPRRAALLACGMAYLPSATSN